MKPARIVFIAVILFVLQLAAVPRMRIAGAAPDLLIILLATIVLGRNPVAAVVVGFLLGFLADLGNASFLGLNALAKSILAYGMSRLGVLLPEHVLYRGIVIFAACLVNDIIVLAVTTSFSPGDMFASFFRYSILSGLYTALLAACVLGVLELFGRRMIRTGGGA